MDVDSEFARKKQKYHITRAWKRNKVSCYTGLRQYYIYFFQGKENRIMFQMFESKVCITWRVLYEIYKNHNVSNVCNRMINIFLNKHSRNTKYHVTNVYENKSIMLQSFEEKQKYHVTKVWKKSNSLISNVFQEEFCTNFYEMTMKATFATER